VLIGLLDTLMSIKYCVAMLHNIAEVSGYNIMYLSLLNRFNIVFLRFKSDCKELIIVHVDHFEWSIIEVELTKEKYDID